jgi:hypothetical protein
MRKTLAVLSIILLVSVISNAQSKAHAEWVKFSNNPIITGSRPTGSPSALEINGEYHMWYINAWNVWYATSADGYNWTGNMPVFADGRQLALGTILYTGTEYQMWYSWGGATGQTGYASSTDGINWVDHGMIIGPGPDAFDAYAASIPFVMFDANEGLYKMWYTAGASTQVGRRIAYATAINPDGPWTKHGLVFETLQNTWYSYSVSSPHVVKDKNGYTMWFNGSTGSPPGVIGHVHSLDGIAWNHSTVELDLLPGSEGEWDDTSVGGPCILQLMDNTRLLYYAGTDYPANTFAIGVAQYSNQPPVLDPIGNKTGQEGQLLEFQITATDPNPNDVLTFNADNLPDGATFDSVTATFSWTPGYDQAGVYENIEFIVSDGNSDPGVDNELITITVGNVNRPPEFAPVDAKTVNENETLQFSVTASDPDGDTIELSTGELPAGASFDQVTGTFSWTPDNTQAGNYVVGFYALDNGVPPLEGELEVAISVGDVPTPIEAVNQLIKYVRGMDIKKCQKIKYIVKLKLTKRFINRGRVWLACFSLNHFIDMVEYDMNHDRITQEDGQKLIDGANYILTQLQ